MTRTAAAWCLGGIAAILLAALLNALAAMAVILLVGIIMTAWERAE